MSEDLTRQPPVRRSSFLHSEPARLTLRHLNNPLRDTRPVESNRLDRVRQNLETRFEEDDDPVLELHPNVVIEREFSFLEVDASIIGERDSNNRDNGINDSTDNVNGEQNNDEYDRDARQLPPTDGDASDTSADTQSENAGRGEFSLTSYDSDTFDPAEDDYIPRADKMSQQRGTSSIAPRVDITPEQISDEIDRLQTAARQSSEMDRNRAPEPTRAGPGTQESLISDMLQIMRDMQERMNRSAAEEFDRSTEVLRAIREIQNRVSRLETAAYDRPDARGRQGRSQGPLDVTYGRTTSDVRSQPGHNIGFLSLKEARNMIPEINGESRERVREFLNASTYAMKNIQPADEAMLLEAILCTKFKGKAMTDFDTRDIRDFEQLKRELETEYLGKRGMTHLQLEFNSLKQMPGENAQEFGRRVEKLARELYEAMEEGQKHSQEQQKAILDIIKMQALHNYQIGLHDDIKMIVRAQRYQSLQEAIAGASAEERVRDPSPRKGQPTNKNISETEQAQYSRNSEIQCHKCGKTGHYGRDCRTSRYANKFLLPKADKSGGINTIECTHCKKVGHKRDECWLLNGRPKTERSHRSKTDATKQAPVSTVRKKKSRETSDESSSSSGSEEDEKPRKNKARAAEEYQVSQITGKHNIHTLNLITLPIQEAKKGKTKFLLDSGAILTLIKVGNLKGDTMVREKRLTLTGVTGHKIHTLGKIKATMDLGSKKIRHTMYVVKDDFPIDHEGILGNDFLTKRKAVISHATKQVHLSRVAFKLQSYKKVNSPPRSRVGIVKDKKPTPRAFIGHCLMEPTDFRCPISVSNGAEKSVEALTPRVTLEEINDTTDILPLHATEKHKSNSARRKRLREQLQTDALSRNPIAEAPAVHMTQQEDDTSREYSEEEKQQILYEYHDSPTGGHQGVTHTMNRIRLQHNWSGMTKDIETYISKCEYCQQNKLSRKTKMPLSITDTPERLFEKCALDIVGPLTLTNSRNKYILTFQDSLTKFSKAIPIKNQKTNTVAKAFVNKVVLEHGVPEKIFTDQGTNFTSKMFKNVCKLLKIEKIQTTTYHPESNGVLERSHRTLTEYLRHYINEDQTDWDGWLPYAMFTYNTTPHTTTGLTPFELVYGHRANLPTALLKPPKLTYSYEDYAQELRKRIRATNQVAREHTKQEKIKTKQQFDKRTNKKTFRVGDKVLLHDETVRRGRPKKLESQWIGPYVIIEKHGDVNYTIKIKRKTLRVHANRLRAFIEE